MPVLPASRATVHELHGSRFTAYAAPATGSRELCAWRVEVPAGTAGAAHRVTREEVLVLLSGALRVTLDDLATDLAVGDAVLVPAGSSLRLDNEGERAAEAWVTTSVGLQAVMADGTWLAPPWVR